MLTSADLQAYFEQAVRRPPTYRGQLAPEFQDALAEYHRDVVADECNFYHSVALSNGDVFDGEWDLRGSEGACLGHLDFSGKRVIEYLPGSGGLSDRLSRNGAELVTLDRPFGVGPESMPSPELDNATSIRCARVAADRLRNAWWFARRELGFDARAVYADILQPPADLGRFDVAVFATVLTQCASPFRVLERAAAMTTATIIVTEPATDSDFAPQLEELRQLVPSLAIFRPSPAPARAARWWDLSPELLTQMLRLLGFVVAETQTHTPRRMPQRPVFTIVAHRRRSGLALSSYRSRRLPAEVGAICALPTT